MNVVTQPGATSNPRLETDLWGKSTHVGISRLLGGCSVDIQPSPPMKQSTVHSLLTARTLHDEAVSLIESEDRHICSAGLVMLQDALEIIFLAMLTEKDIDEHKSLESKGFDELIGEPRNIGIKVPKSGTLKALNKQRVITKHYGQLAEPVIVREYAEAADVAKGEAQDGRFQTI